MTTTHVKIMPFYIALFLIPFILGAQKPGVYKTIDEDKLPYGNSFSMWEKKQKTNKIYHVAQNHPRASDNNAGTKEEPFLTISKAANILQPGEKVIIHEGVYREQITPARGGSGAEKLIIYQAAEDEKVIVKGSVSCDPKHWKPSRGWQAGGSAYLAEQNQDKQQVWQYDLHDIDFKGYNPFGLLNLMQDQEYLDYTQVNMTPHFKKRGWVIIDGQRIEQVLKPPQLKEKENGAFWAEHNGQRIHVRFPEGKTPENVTAEISIREQLFAPKEYGLGYIKIKGIHFMHAANGFPVPQRGAVSASRGHHWIIEDCIIEGVNSLGMDLGNEMWHTEKEEIIGWHIIRRNTFRNCGLAGLQGMRAKNYLVEDNLFENIGWHDAEHGWEAGAIKFHLSENTLIRRNVFRNIRHAPGIWLDYLASKNCRITKNVFSGITSARGCVYIEVSHHKMSIDHNVFHDTHSQYWISGDYGAGGSAL
ncbi:MAG: right-handed parallel beta-helix repeat-containing protein, partial [Bacteroidota bacterium]